MRIGVDLDHTIVCYADAFQEYSRLNGLVVSSKIHLRDLLKDAGEEEKWQDLQGVIYGPWMKNASPFPDVLLFIQKCRAQEIEAFIVSHRTKLSYRGSYPLQGFAKSWLAEQGFGEVPAFFAPSQEEKIMQISNLSLDVFIDDLPEIFLSDLFPQTVRKLLFDPDNLHCCSLDYEKVSSWKQIISLLNL